MLTSSLSDWDVVAKREPNAVQRSWLYKGTAPHLIRKRSNFVIPSGVAYDPDALPYPWFHFAAHSLLEPIDPLPVPEPIEDPIVPTASPCALPEEDDDVVSLVATSFRSLKSSLLSSSQKISEKRGICAAILRNFKIRFGMLVEVKPKVGGGRMVID